MFWFKLYLQYRVPRIILGLIDRRSRGVRCIVMRVFSRVKEGIRLLMWYVCLPRWVVMSMYREYRAVITMLVPIRIIDMEDQENVDITTNSSPIRLIVGGRARLVRLARSHQAAINGRMVCRPRARIMVRL